MGIGVSGALGIPGGLGTIRGIRGVGSVRVYWGAGWECRYPEARRGIGGIRGHWGSKMCWGLLGASGNVRGVLWGWQGV